jgi:hypothetical protein
LCPVGGLPACQSRHRRTKGPIKGEIIKKGNVILELWEKYQNNNKYININEGNKNKFNIGNRHTYLRYIYFPLDIF